MEPRIGTHTIFSTRLANYFVSNVVEYRREHYHCCTPWIVKKLKSNEHTGGLKSVELYYRSRGMISRGRGALPQHAGCIRGVSHSRGCGSSFRGIDDKGGDRLSLPHRWGARSDPRSGLLERLS